MKGVYAFKSDILEEGFLKFGKSSQSKGNTLSYVYHPLYYWSELCKNL